MYLPHAYGPAVIGLCDVSSARIIHSTHVNYYANEREPMRRPYDDVSTKAVFTITTRARIVCCERVSTVTQFLQIYFTIDILFTQFTSATSRS